MKLCVVGTGRSGTTMAWRMFADHPDLLMFLESYWHAVMFDRYGMRAVPGGELLRVLRRTTFPDHPDPVIFEGTLRHYGVPPAEVYDEYARTWGDTPVNVVGFNDRLSAILLARTGRMWYGDKTPHYYRHMAALQMMWPDLVFVNVIRHGVAAARSMQRHPGFRINAKVGVDDWSAVAALHPYLAVPEGEVPLAEYLGLWARQLLRARDEATRLRPGSYLEVRFEELVTTPARALGRVCEFVGLPAHPAWVRRQEGFVRPERLTTGGRPEVVPPDAAALLADLGYAVDDPLPAVRLAG